MLKSSEALWNPIPAAIEGNATTTIVLSQVTIRVPMLTAANSHQSVRTARSVRCLNSLGIAVLGVMAISPLVSPQLASGMRCRELA